MAEAGVLLLPAAGVSLASAQAWPHGLALTDKPLARA